MKSGKDYAVHSALDRFLSIEEYHVAECLVFSNERRVWHERGITYLPIYFIMFV